LVLSF